MNVRMETDAIFTHQNIPQRAGCPCQTTSSWSDAPARPQDGPRRRRSGDKETTKQSGVVFQSPVQLNFAFIAPHLSQELQKMLMLGKNKDFRLKRFAKIQLQQIRTKLARSREKPSSLKNMHWWASVSPCPLRETWPWLGPQWWSTSFCTIQTCKNTLTLTNPLDPALFFL